VPDDIRAAWDRRDAGAALERDWLQRFEAYRAAHPLLAAEFERREAGELPANWKTLSQELLRNCQQQSRTLATRKSSQQVLEALGPVLPELLGGSADLAPSNLTQWSGSQSLSAEIAGGNYIHYGVREFGMSAMMNGLALHGGFIPYGGTFLMFMEYARNAVRMAALMGIRTLFVYTHDSIGLGEDGPTHQPIEQIASLRQTPNLDTWRPCDETETAAAWCSALERSDGPSALVLSRQNLPAQPRNEQQLGDIGRGGYILSQTADRQRPGGAGAVVALRRAFRAAGCGLPRCSAAAGGTRAGGDRDGAAGRLVSLGRPRWRRDWHIHLR
jgi:transketolase